MDKISIVIPVYYNEANLPHTVPRLGALAAANPQFRFEFIFVDDGSGDRSHELLTGFAARDARIKVVKLSRNFGSNAATLAGFHYATGDCAVMMAADLQDPPELIITMAERWQAGHKIVLAAREDREDTLASRITAKIFYWLFKRFAIPDIPDKGCDFALIDRTVLHLLLAMGEKNLYIVGLLLWMGFNRDVVSYSRRSREHGKSRWTLAKKIKYFIDAFVSFSYLPMRLASSLGILLALAGFLWALAVVLNKVIAGVPVQGWASLMTVVLLVSGVQLITLGIFGEYLWRNFDETRQRPAFIVDEVLGVDGADTRRPAFGCEGGATLPSQAIGRAPCADGRSTVSKR
jgi:dolichol-phosphate mannosyltransferase